MTACIRGDDRAGFSARWRLNTRLSSGASSPMVDSAKNASSRLTLNATIPQNTGTIRACSGGIRPARLIATTTRSAKNDQTAKRRQAAGDWAPFGNEPSRKADGLGKKHPEAGTIWIDQCRRKRHDTGAPEDNERSNRRRALGSESPRSRGAPEREGPASNQPSSVQVRPDSKKRRREPERGRSFLSAPQYSHQQRETQHREELRSHLLHPRQDAREREGHENRRWTDPGGVGPDNSPHTAERHRHDRQLQEDQAGRPRRPVGRGHDDLRQPLVIGPRLVRREGVGVRQTDRRAVDDVSTESDVSPQIRIGPGQRNEAEDDEQGTARQDGALELHGASGDYKKRAGCEKAIRQVCQ